MIESRRWRPESFFLQKCGSFLYCLGGGGEGLAARTWATLPHNTTSYYTTCFYMYCIHASH
jgi:hypothetical protein